MRAWENFLLAQEAELGKETVVKWLRTLKIVRFDACNLYLEAKDSFQTLWFEEHMRPKVLAKLFNGNNKPIKVHLTLANQIAGKKIVKRYSTADNKPPPFRWHLMIWILIAILIIILLTLKIRSHTSF